MAGLRALAARAAPLLRGVAAGAEQRAGAQLQQRRGAADLYYKPNPQIEAWSKRREELEYEFRWTRSTIASVLIGGIVVPLGMYHFIAYTGHLEDEWNGRETGRDFMWSASPKRAAPAASPEH
jgi:hypothetical protein